MTHKFSSALLTKKSYSNSLKREVVNLYGNKPNFPKDDAQVAELLGTVESLLPAGLNASKQKTYMMYLLKQLYGLTPPGFILGEDNDRAKSTLTSFELAIKERRLTGQQTDINSYETLADLLEASTDEKEDTGRAEFDVFNLPEEQDGANPKADVAKGSKVIAKAGDWTIFKIKEGDPNGKAAGSWLGHNKWWNVGWCVGRDRSWNSVSYMDQGDFWFLVKGGRPVVAISSEEGEITMWDRADNPTNLSDSGSSNAKMPSLVATAERLGVSIEISEAMTLPGEIVTALKLLAGADAGFAEGVNQNLLVEVNTDVLDQVIAQTPAPALIEDFNQLSNSSRSSGVVKAIMARCLSRNNKQGIKDFSAHWGDFSESSILVYIDALGMAGWKSLPVSLEDFLVERIEALAAQQ